MDDVAEGIARDLFNQHMNMVRHDRPRKQLISFAVEIPDGILNHCGDVGIAQGAAAEPAIDCCFDLLSEVSTTRRSSSKLIEDRLR
jgi:hypothetical protein